MKEIGEKLREARESMNITLDEVAEDLKLRPSQIESIENGDIESFKDITYLKYFIRDYAKYLGLNKEEMVDEFNEYLFDYTSRISLDDIKNAKKTDKKEEVVKIKSPYTIEHKRNFFKSNLFIYMIIAILLAFIGYFIYSLVNTEDGFNDNSIVNK